MPAFMGEGRHQFGEGVFTGANGDGAHRLAQGAVCVFTCHRDGLLGGVVQGFLGRAIIQHLKMGWQSRFHRKARQKRLAERVNGFDAQPTRQVEHFGKQAAGALAHFVIGFFIDAGINLGVETLVRKAHPCPQFVGDADGHFSRCRLGEGDT